jgi:hypothetical protein
MRAKTGAGVKNLNEQVLYEFPYSHPDPTTSTDGAASLESTPASLRLNPRFVCWLMGWPLIGLGGSNCWETELSHFKLRMHSALSGLLSGANEWSLGEAA